MKKTKLPTVIKKLGRPAIEALLTGLPYGAGTVASVFLNHVNERKTQKIIDTLESLQKRVQILDTVTDKLLTEDQVCELLEKHLVEIGITSDEEKINFLRNSLNNSFTLDIEFGEKELYLETLKGLTTPEILLLNHLYLKDDPFIIKHYPEPPFKELEPGIFSNQIHVSAYGVVALHPQYYEATYVINEGNKTLEDFFKETFDTQWATFIKGSSSRLDAKGLSNLRINFSNRTLKTLNMKPIEKKPISFPGALPVDGMHSRSQLTAFEAAKTEFGEAFIKYISR